MDDLVLISQSNEGLQESINLFNNYCESWKLSINHLKTKVLIISKSKLKTISIFQLNGDVLEIVNEHIFTGFIINSKGHFDSTMKMLTDKAPKAMFRLNGIILKHNLLVFDTFIVPILTYGSET